MTTVSIKSQTKTSEAATKKFYLAAWRWHFYAGLFVVPFIIMLSLTGLIMVLHTPIEAYQYGDKLFIPVEDSSNLFSVEAQAQIIRDAYPTAIINQYILPPAPDRSSQFSITPRELIDGEYVELSEITIFVNPYTGDVLGKLDTSTTWYAWANDVHGTFFMGDFGDYLIEIAAGLSILLVITGVYLWWPRDGKTWRQVLFPSLKQTKRVWWRDLHSSIGFWFSVGILFFMLSGMAWTAFWGGELTQAWSSFPAEKFRAPLSDETHASLNRGVLEEVPWALEQTYLPASGSLAGSVGIPEAFPVSLDTVVAYAKDNGFSTFRVSLPSDAEGVWTVSADTMSGDIADPRQDRTLYIDQYTGNVLGEVTFDDYSIMGKGMAAGISLHMGEAGLINLALNVAFCLAMLFISISGVVMWWLRHPKKSPRLAAPPIPQDMRVWRGAVGLMIAISLLFPLVAGVLLTILLLDFLVLSRISALKTMFN